MAAAKAAAAKGAQAARPGCESCPYFQRPSGDRKRIEQVGGTYRGECKRYPLAQPKAPDDWCGEHPKIAVPAPIVAMEKTA